MTALSADERQELAQSVRSACERLAPEERVRAVAYGEEDRRRGDVHSGFDTALWDVLCNQVGVAAIALPEHLGGAGYGASALGVVAHELGRALAPVPFISSTVLATGLLARPDGERSRRRQTTDRADRRSPHCGCGSHRRRRVVAPVRGDAARQPAPGTAGASTARCATCSAAPPRTTSSWSPSPRTASRRYSCSTPPSTASSPRPNACWTAPDRWPPSR